MNQEFHDNYALHVNIETDFFDTGNTVMTSLEDRPKQTSRNKKKGYKLYVLFVLIICLNLLVSFDHGVLPAAAVTIMRDLDLNQA